MLRVRKESPELSTGLGNQGGEERKSQGNGGSRRRREEVTGKWGIKVEKRGSHREMGDQGGEERKSQGNGGSRRRREEVTGKQVPEEGGHGQTVCMHEKISYLVID
jgi:hypothetical protein